MTAPAFAGEFADPGGPWDLEPAEDPAPAGARAEPVPGAPGHATVVRGLAGPRLLAGLAGMLAGAPWTPVGPHGMASFPSAPGDPVGPWRSTVVSPGIAGALWRRLRPFLSDARHADGVTVDETGTWEPVGVNPATRVLRYADGDFLYGHHDGPWEPADGTRSMLTLVLYLDQDPTVTGGETRFLADPAAGTPVAARTFDDLVARTTATDVVAGVGPVPGDALLFDHRVLHDAAPVHVPGAATGHGKTVLRTDVMYRRVLDPFARASAHPFRHTAARPYPGRPS